VLALAWALIASTTCLLPASLVGQERKLQVVSRDSRADLYFGSTDNPKSFGIGTALVSGNVSLDANDVTRSVFVLTFYPANRTPDDPAGSTSNSGPLPGIRFESQSVSVRKDGGLEVSGLVTVITVNRNIVVDVGESYSSPKYGPPEISHTRQMTTLTFLPFETGFARVKSGGGVFLQTSQPSQSLVLTATTIVNREAFPELLASVVTSAWPALVDQQDCLLPTSVGEDFSGPVCSGTNPGSIASVAQTTQNGEDYSGVRFGPPAGDQLTIQLHIELAHVGGARPRVPVQSIKPGGSEADADAWTC